MENASEQRSGAGDFFHVGSSGIFLIFPFIINHIIQIRHHPTFIEFILIWNMYNSQKYKNCVYYSNQPLHTLECNSNNLYFINEFINSNLEANLHLNYLFIIYTSSLLVKLFIVSKQLICSLILHIQIQCSLDISNSP